MKKNILSKMSVMVVALIFAITPITVSASSKNLTDPLVITAEQAEKEVYEEQKEVSYGALTPEGNLDLVDDYGNDQGAGKQFITVETKNGQYFYIIIDRDDNGTETVHFLNKVDEKDLLAVMEEKDVQEYLEQSAETVQPESGEPKDGSGTDEEKTATDEEVEEDPAVVGLPPMTSLLLIGGVIGIGGLGGYFYLKKNKNIAKTGSVSDQEEEEELPDDLDETEFDDENLDADEEEE